MAFSLAPLAGAALSWAPATGLRAWLLPAPLVLLDAGCAEFLLAADPLPRRVVVWLGAGVLGYAAAGLWYAAGTGVRRRWNGGPGLSALVFTLAGTTWGATLLIALHVLAEPAIEAGAVPVMAAAMQVTIATLVAVVLYSAEQARLARRAAAAEHRRWRHADAALRQARADARREFHRWITRFFDPELHELTARVRAGTAGIADVDAFRESVVRATSRRLHPRIAALGPGPALASVTRGRGAVVTVADADLTQPELTCLVRCLDLVLHSATDQHPDCRPDVRLTDSGRGVTVTITGLPAAMDGLDLRIPEIAARLRARGGGVDTAAGSVTLLLPRPGAARGPAPDPDVPPAAALAVAALVVPTACVLGLLDGTWATAALGAAATLSLPGFTTLLWRHGSPNRWRVTAVAVLTSALVTSVWLLRVPATTTGAAVVFAVANAVVVAVVLEAALVTQRTLRRRAGDVAELRRRTRAVEHDCTLVARDIDDLRTSVAQLLHSQVQARLAAAAGRLERRPPDRDGALRTLAVIADVDVPALRVAIGSGGAAASLPELLAALGQRTDLAVHLHADPAVLAAVRAGGAEPQVCDVIREAVTNAVRHGRARVVHVRLTREPDAIRVVVSDDGTGCDRAHHLGLGLSVVDHATGGRWRLDPRPRGGSVLEARC